MKTETAVEWLLENSHIIPKTELNKSELIKKAKEMEKDQIVYAFNQDLYSQSVDRMRYQDGLEYYNETYGK